MALTGVLALAACGTDNNGGGSKAASPKASSCAKGSLNASGSTAQANAMTQWIKAYQSTCSSATVNYQANGSGAGIQQFSQGSTDFAGSDSPLKPEETGPATKRCKGNKPVHLPMVPGPIAVVYNLPGVADLQIDGPTLGKIFSGKIKKWDDPAIKAQNSGAKLPSSPIQTFHRSESSGTTDNFTKYLAAAAGKNWTFDHDKTWKAPGGQGSKGSDGIASSVKQTTGALSYVELSFAQSSKLSMAKVKNASGKYVALTNEAVGALISSAKAKGTGNDLQLELDYNTMDPKAYPIALVTYEIVCSKGLPSDKVALEKGFLSYAASQKGQDTLTSLGYAPLPDTVATKVRQSIQSIS
ncbi:MAG: phosphate ABC transporter substrate-binding protein PstS [Acidothermales bacterium]|nr:phosphate ABC transporter substrate-binding protein PstS [Acidothermales bacterium]